MATRGRIRDDVVPTNYVQRRGVAPPPDTKSPSSAARLVRSVDFMCGITGFWAPSLSSDAAAALLEAMNRAVLHRGPHGGAPGSSPPEVRASVIDASPSSIPPTGLQPMHSASGRYTMTFNGEVYNFQDLKDRLEAQGRAPKWRGSSDTEVMLAAIESWGLELPCSASSNFAFGLRDARDRTLTLVRDRVGVKPLYYSQTPAASASAASLEPAPLPRISTAIVFLVAGGLSALQLRSRPTHHFSGYLARRPLAPSSPSPAPPPRPASPATRDPAEIALTGQAHPFQGTEEEAVDQLDHLLRDAVKLRMVADVPLGAFLSGGIDSSTVVALMQAQCSRPVHTFSIENENAAYDEGNTARAVARHLNTHHTTFTVTPRDALDVIPLLPTMFDEPFADSSQIPTYLVSKLARRDVTVALSG